MTKQTGVNANAQSQRYGRHVTNSELAGLAENIKSHCADLACVKVAIAYWYSTAYHVRISNRFHLSHDRIYYYFCFTKKRKL